MIRSSKSRALASRSRRWYIVYAADIDSSNRLRVSLAASSGSRRSFLWLLTQCRTAPGW